jgi:hypothetical protein
MKNFVLTTLLTSALMVSCTQPTTVNAKTPAEQNNDANNEIIVENRQIEFTLQNQPFAYDKNAEDNLEVDIIHVNETTWLFHLNSTNQSTQTRSMLQFTVENFDIANWQNSTPTITKAMHFLYSENENPPFAMESNFKSGDSQIQITKTEFLKTSGTTGLFMDYYLLSGKFSASFHDILGANKVSIENGTFANMVLMRIRQ